jgi:hypothetical protein
MVQKGNDPDDVPEKEFFLPIELDPPNRRHGAVES